MYEYINYYSSMIYCRVHDLLSEMQRIIIITLITIVLVIVIGYSIMYYLYYLYHIGGQGITTPPSHTSPGFPTHSIRTYSCIVYLYNATVSFKDYNGTHIITFLNLTIANYGVTPVYFTNLSLYINKTYVHVMDYRVLLSRNLSNAQMYISLRIGFFHKNSSLTKFFKPNNKAEVYIVYRCHTQTQVLTYRTRVVKI